VTIPEKLTTALASVVALFVVGVIGAFWWARMPPRRPSDVPATAVYYPGLAVGLPAHKRGSWVYCWFDTVQNMDRCRVTSVKGEFQYQGVFLPYQRHGPVPENELAIDPQLMADEQEQVEVVESNEESSSPGFKVVPLVYLRNGEILIPERAYETGKKRLDEKRANRSKSRLASKQGS
jgi:hypothetical protein